MILSIQEPALDQWGDYPNKAGAGHDDDSDQLGFLSDEVAPLGKIISCSEPRHEGISNTHVHDPNKRPGNYRQDTVNSQIPYQEHLGDDQPIQLSQHQSGSIETSHSQRL